MNECVMFFSLMCISIGIVDYGLCYIYYKKSYEQNKENKEVSKKTFRVNIVGWSICCAVLAATFMIDFPGFLQGIYNLIFHFILAFPLLVFMLEIIMIFILKIEKIEEIWTRDED